MPLIRLVASELSPKKSPEPELSVPAASLRRPERLKQQTRKKRHQRWTEVMALHNKGCSFREISRITGLSRVAVSRWGRSGTFPEMSTRHPKRGLLAPWRKGWLPPVITAARLPSVSRVSRWLMPWRIIRGEENYASRFINLMCEKEPEVKIAQQLVLEFYRILKTQNKSQLSSWFTRVHESGSAELRRVAAGMEADAAAIREAISSRWSNGVVEGHVNRLKMLKR